MIKLNKNFTKEVPRLAQSYLRPDGIYALSHSVGPMCKAAAEAMNTRFIEPWQTLGGDAWPTWLTDIQRFNSELGVLLNAEGDNFCPQPSVSIAFSQWLAAVSKSRPSKKARTVLMHEDAFASLGFAVQGLCKTYHLKLRLLDCLANDLDAWDEALKQADVFAVLLTHAHSNTGCLTAITKILNIAKQYQVLGAVDIAQSVGIIPIDLSAWQVDCVVGSCVKWLSGGPGAAFMYIPDGKADELMPEHLAWFSHENPFEFDIRKFKAAKGVMRFWGGTPSIAPYTMAASAICEHNRFGTNVFRQHNLALMQLFLTQYPLPIPIHYQSLANLKNGSSDITFEKYSGEHSATLCLPISSSRADKIKLRLNNESVKFDSRDEVIRLSFGTINHSNDVERVLECFAY